METLSVSRAFDDRGRFNPQLIPDSEKVWECDSVIVSIGQTGELEWVKPEDGVEVTPRGTLAVDRETLMTTAPGVFAGGDIAFGPRLIINAVADGQRAARGIHAISRTSSPGWCAKASSRPSRNMIIQMLARCATICAGRAASRRYWPVDRRIGVAQVEIGFDEEAAREQGGRCLICTINPIFDGDLCILCNGCVDVCPMDCLKLVPASAVWGDEKVAAVIASRAAEWPTVGHAV